MYSRNVIKAPDYLVVNGKPQFGNFSSSPRSISINDVRFPYGILPLPTFITNMRIRSNFSFIFDTAEYYGTIDIIGVKIAGFYEVNVFSKKTNQKYSYRGITGIRRHFVPKNLEKAICSTYLRSRYIRFAWDKKNNRFSLVFHMQGNSVLPNIDASFISKYNDKSNPNFTAVIPAPTTRRCYVSHQRVMDATGGIFVSKDNVNPFFQSEKSTCFLVSTRAYYRFRFYGSFANSVGIYEGKQFALRLANVSCHTKENEKFNENTLFYDKKLTTMPPVRITHPYGHSKKWIIQDTEGMVDLVFTPISLRQKLLSLVLLNAHYDFIYGTFEGVLVDKDGNKINLKDFPGIVKDLRCRL